MFLIDDLLLMPVKGLWGTFKRIHEMADREFSDGDTIRERLLELRLRYEIGEISDKEYLEQERELMARLEAIRH